MSEMRLKLYMNDSSEIVGDPTTMKSVVEKLETLQTREERHSFLDAVVNHLASLAKDLDNGVRNLGNFSMTLKGDPIYFNVESIAAVHMVGYADYIRDILELVEAVTQEHLEAEAEE